MTSSSNTAALRQHAMRITDDVAHFNVVMVLRLEGVLPVRNVTSGAGQSCRGGIVPANANSQQADKARA